VKLKLSDFELIVPDVEAAVGFYKDTLGLPMRFRNETFADFDLGYGSRLALWEAPHAAKTCSAEAVGQKGNHMMGAIRLDSTKAIDDAFSELKHKGVNMYSEPKSWPWGAYGFYFRDPNDYLWEVYFWETSPRVLEEK
jgi:catechol 2,3-dioxygenase-like lactoylglutathione lyase family enzyme